ncbi:hypothetical protein VISI1226_20744 [Vibrio sinaloensis DSM 21326]|uniref:HEAT repeat domain-containing protein n=1 Tax=Vibrio sinaloensis DSM 21326 TaxID=945550 RepID=E8M203_PHOS4|nr:hypothetical protein [Vibrio sinaloensis]EGA71955.1 hypothetical protein VISI1226_20744 [Vibrio sinaloensis DSM 21326]
MQQGMLSSVLLSALLMGAPAVSATEMAPARVEMLLEDEQIHQKVAQLLQYAIEDNIDSLTFALERLSLPQQEVARYLLLSKIEQQHIILTPKMALFIEQQKAMVPTYQVLERGEGYEFSVPAFNYPAIASRLLKQWHQDQSTLSFVLQAERGELDLKAWLSGNDYQVQARESLLIRELDSLSPEAVHGLSKQLTEEAIVSWLPSSQVMVRLAQVSEDAEVYKLVWLMRADFNSQQELHRLAQVGDDFSIQQIMSASQNPSLKQDAFKALTRIRPMSDQTKAFLIERMALKDDAPIVAQELARQGYTSWLEELASHNQKVRSRAILNALSQ